MSITLPTERELLDEWLAVLTVMGEQLAGRADRPVVNAIGRRNFSVQLETAVSARDRQALGEFTAAVGELYNRQSRAHWTVSEQLLGMVRNATGETREAVLRRLAVELSE
ncbi:hypothetical protein GCM10023321_34290 [Pseudonocardia eucalypti]|uniref:Uncharacterized protein n=1 Tax=Pseudonocardia eucalypti TaxID=648755 RepID=A0ABP9Q541_9PSEU|nr:hypothetical protein [Pseudonocardia eucalypti]